MIQNESISWKAESDRWSILLVNFILNRTTAIGHCFVPAITGQHGNDGSTIEQQNLFGESECCQSQLVEQSLKRSSVMPTNSLAIPNLGETLEYFSPKKYESISKVSLILWLNQKEKHSMVWGPLVHAHLDVSDLIPPHLLGCSPVAHHRGLGIPRRIALNLKRVRHFSGPMPDQTILT